MSAILTLQPRLQAIADLVPPGTKLTDVGTDHGYLPVWLLLQKRISAAIATDIVSAPLEHARHTAAQYALEEGISFRLCDGLAGVSPEETDTVAVAGMGGETISHILASAPWTKGTLLLLQPMSKVEFLREWLADQGYHVFQEKLCLDKGFLYSIFLVGPGEAQALAPEQAWYGWVDREDPLYDRHIKYLIEKTRRKISGLENARAADSADKLAEFKRLLAVLEEKQCTP